MPKFAVRRPVAIALSTAMVATSVAALLVSSAATQAGAAAAPGSTQRASVNGAGTQSGDGGDGSVISADGNSIAFTSFGNLDNLGTGEHRNVFVRDMRDPDPKKHRTVMISRGQFTRVPPPPPPPPPTTTTTTSRPPIIRYGPDNMVDLGARAQPGETIRPGETVPDGSSSEPTISADGRYVAFVTRADNIVEQVDRSNPDLLVCDRDPDGDGILDENIPDATGRLVRDYRYFRIPTYQSSGRVAISQPHFSADAGRIVWHERISGEGTYTLVLAGELPLVPLANGRLGRVAPAQAERVLPDEFLGFFGRIDNQFDPAVSGDGNHAVLTVELSQGCDCTDPPRFHAVLSVDLRDRRNVFRVDVEKYDTNGDTLIPRYVSNNFGEFVMHPAVNFDGTMIAFEAEEFDRQGNFSLHNQPNVFLVKVDYDPDDALRFVTDTKIVSRNNAGTLINGAAPALSADGRYVAFITDAVLAHDGVDRGTGDFSCIRPEPVIGLTHDRQLQFAAAVPQRPAAPRTVCQVVVRDLLVDQQRDTDEQSRLKGTLISPSITASCEPPRDETCAGIGDSANPSLSGDGSRVGFDSEADDLVQQDTNERTDVFVRTLEPTLLRGSTVNFGIVEIGQSRVGTTSFERTGAGPLVLEAVTIGGANAADFSITGRVCQTTLHQTERCRVSVRFAPRAVGDRRGQVQVRVRGGQVITADLLGSGTEKPVPPPKAPVFAVSPASLDFGSRLLLSNGPASVVTVTNQGESPLVISGVTPVGSGTSADYAVSANTCGASVPANGTCQVSVTFSPTLPGERLAALEFRHNAAPEPTLVGLRGQAGQPTVEINPGVTPPSRVVTVTGKGFPAGKAVTLKFTTAQETAKATVAADGTFRASLLIFAKAKAENRTVVATVDGSPALFANGQLLVVFPTVSPAEFVVRG